MAYSHQAPRAMSIHRTRHPRAGALAMPRRRGAGAGTLLVILGVWGAIIPFIGPMFGYSWDTAASWTFTLDRLWLNILPGAAAFFGGIILIAAADRLSAMAGSWLAIAGGVWFLIGPSVSLLWGSPVATTGIGSGSQTQRFIEQIGYFYGLGAVVTALAAGALARVLVRSERDAQLLESAAGTATDTTETAVPDRRVTEPTRAPVAEAGVAADIPPGGQVTHPAASEPAPGNATETMAGPPAERSAPRAADPMSSNAGETMTDRPTGRADRPGDAQYDRPTGRADRPGDAQYDRDRRRD